MGVTSSRDLAIVVWGHTIVMGWPTKKHKVVYVLVIGLHQSHWVTHHSHCVARLSHWAAHLSHCAAHHRHGVPTVVLGKYTIVDAISRSASGYLTHLDCGSPHLHSGATHLLLLHPL